MLHMFWYFVSNGNSPIETNSYYEGKIQSDVGVGFLLFYF